MPLLFLHHIIWIHFEISIYCPSILSTQFCNPFYSLLARSLQTDLSSSKNNRATIKSFRILSSSILHGVRLQCSLLFYRKVAWSKVKMNSPDTLQHTVMEERHLCEEERLILKLAINDRFTISKEATLLQHNNRRLWLWHKITLNRKNASEINGFLWKVLHKAVPLEANIQKFWIPIAS